MQDSEQKRVAVGINATGSSVYFDGEGRGHLAVSWR
jgi:hypothetical protein